jgi:hypothetical protein
MDIDEERNPHSTEDEAMTYYKLVAKVADYYFSIYDGKVEYVIGRTLSQKAMAAHRGGYYVYNTPQEAVFADVPFKTGGFYTAP